MLDLHCSLSFVGSLYFEEEIGYSFVNRKD
uniref:Uncharacterized protein n=1 Tax=Populus trichocarpa TaxID=3694 RepID=A0A3N7FPU5_POPTR